MCNAGQCQTLGKWYGFSDTVELHLTGLIETANHPGMLKIRIIEFFSLKIGLIGSLKCGKKSTNDYCRLHVSSSSRR